MQKQPVVREVNGEDAIVIRPMMYITLTYDHRVNDGAKSGSFFRDFREDLQMSQESVSGD